MKYELFLDSYYRQKGSDIPTLILRYQNINIVEYNAMLDTFPYSLIKITKIKEYKTDIDK